MFNIIIIEKQYQYNWSFGYQSHHQYEGANQPKSTGPRSLEEADFDCKYPKYVSLINLALFILKKFFLGSVFHCALFDQCMISNTLCHP